MGWRAGDRRGHYAIDVKIKCNFFKFRFFIPVHMCMFATIFGFYLLFILLGVIFYILVPYHKWKVITL